MKKTLLLLALTLAFGTLTGCDPKKAETPPASPVHAQTITPAEAPTQNENGKVISHAQGTVQVHKIPSRIVVFDFGALDTMDALKVEGVVALPKKNLPGYLAEYAQDSIANAGGMKKPDMQTITDLKPDFIIINGRQNTAYEGLNGIAPTANLSLTPNAIWTASRKTL